MVSLWFLCILVAEFSGLALSAESWLPSGSTIDGAQFASVAVGASAKLQHPGGAERAKLLNDLMRSERSLSDSKENPLHKSEDFPDPVGDADRAADIAERKGQAPDSDAESEAPPERPEAPPERPSSEAPDSGSESEAPPERPSSEEGGAGSETSDERKDHHNKGNSDNGHAGSNAEGHGGNDHPTKHRKASASPAPSHSTKGHHHSDKHTKSSSKDGKKSKKGLSKSQIKRDLQNAKDNDQWDKDHHNRQHHGPSGNKKRDYRQHHYHKKSYRQHHDHSRRPHDHKKGESNVQSGHDATGLLDRDQHLQQHRGDSPHSDENGDSDQSSGSSDGGPKSSEKGSESEDKGASGGSDEDQQGGGPQSSEESSQNEDKGSSGGSNEDQQGDGPKSSEESSESEDKGSSGGSDSDKDKHGGGPKSSEESSESEDKESSGGSDSDKDKQGGGPKSSEESSQSEHKGSSGGSDEDQQGGGPKSSEESSEREDKRSSDGSGESGSGNEGPPPDHGGGPKSSEESSGSEDKKGLPKQDYQKADPLDGPPGSLSLDQKLDHLPISEADWDPFHDQRPLKNDERRIQQIKSKAEFYARIAQVNSNWSSVQKHGTPLSTQPEMHPRASEAYTPYKVPPEHEAAVMKDDNERKIIEEKDKLNKANMGGPYAGMAYAHTTPRDVQKHGGFQPTQPHPKASVAPISHEVRPQRAPAEAAETENDYEKRVMEEKDKRNKENMGGPYAGMAYAHNTQRDGQKHDGSQPAEPHLQPSAAPMPHEVRPQRVPADAAETENDYEKRTLEEKDKRNKENMGGPYSGMAYAHTSRRDGQKHGVSLPTQPHPTASATPVPHEKRPQHMPAEAAETEDDYERRIMEEKDKLNKQNMGGPYSGLAWAHTSRKDEKQKRDGSLASKQGPIGGGFKVKRAAADYKGQQYEEHGVDGKTEGESHNANGTWWFPGAIQKPEPPGWWAWTREANGNRAIRWVRNIPAPEWKWSNQGKYYWSGHHRRRGTWQDISGKDWQIGNHDLHKHMMGEEIRTMGPDVRWPEKSRNTAGVKPTQDFPAPTWNTQ